MAWCEENGVGYIFGLAGNRALHRFAYGVADDLKVRRAEAGAEKMRSFAAFDYAAGSWNRERRVVARLEATARGFDARYIVTSLGGEPRHLYEDIYCARGQAETRTRQARGPREMPFCEADRARRWGWRRASGSLSFVRVPTSAMLLWPSRGQARKCRWPSGSDRLNS